MSDKIPDMLALMQEDMAALRKQLEIAHNCGRCGGPETTDKDCECGGSGLATERIHGLYAAIDYFRDIALKGKADTKRLDWCEERGEDFNAEGCRQGFGVFENTTSNPHIVDRYWQCATLREAIDEAMTASADTGQEKG